MSAQARLFGAQPDEGSDVAYTPARLVTACVELLAADLQASAGLVWEAHCGAGAWLDALSHCVGHQRLLASDADAVAVAQAQDDGWQVSHHDALLGPPDDAHRPRGRHRPVWAIVGNPPWSTADQHLRMALSIADHLVAWVLPFAWLVPAERHWVLRDCPPDEIIALHPRVAYGGPGRDGGSPPRDSALFVWRRHHRWGGRASMRVLCWEQGVLLPSAVAP